MIVKTNESIREQYKKKPYLGVYDTPEAIAEYLKEQGSVAYAEAFMAAVRYEDELSRRFLSDAQTDNH